MKSIVVWMGAVLLSACASAPRVASDAVPANAAPVSGAWTGTYTCLQGETGLTLSLAGAANGLVEGTFLFYPTPSNPNAATGKFIVRGWHYSDRSLVLSPGAWLERPDGYRTVSLRGRLDADERTFTGVIPECLNTRFSIQRSD